MDHQYEVKGPKILGTAKSVTADQRLMLCFQKLKGCVDPERMFILTGNSRVACQGKRRAGHKKDHHIEEQQ
jgi:hypothetical protein